MENVLFLIISLPNFIVVSVKTVIMEGIVNSIYWNRTAVYPLFLNVKMTAFVNMIIKQKFIVVNVLFFIKDYNANILLLIIIGFIILSQ